MVSDTDMVAGTKTSILNPGILVIIAGTLIDTAHAQNPA